MKIAVASNDEITVAKDFGRTKGFVIAEVEDGRVTSWKYRKIDLTKYTRKLREGNYKSDIQNQALALLNDCKVLILNVIDKPTNFIPKFYAIEIYFTTEMHVATAINYYLAGILKTERELH